jgi:hypothetical protein
MAEVTSGTRLTIIVLTEDEANELAGLLHEHYWSTLKADENGWPLQELYDALVPTDEDE